MPLDLDSHLFPAKPPANRPRILITEDDQFVANICRGKFKQEGFELLKLWQRHPKLAHIPVIMLTAKNEETLKTGVLENGALEYLTKPFSPDALVVLIRQHATPRDQRAELRMPA